MRPTFTDATNVNFVLNDPETGKKIVGTDLPAERFIADDVPGSDRGIVHETTWTPDQGERRAIANGAPVLLRVWGTAHPPVQILAGEPDAARLGELRALMDERHVSRAIGALFGALAQRTNEHPDADEPEILLRSGIEDLDAVITGDAFITMWMSALEATAEPHEQAKAADPQIDPDTGILDLRTDNAAMPKPDPITDTDRAILDDAADRGQE